jgi:hypothetical protein
MNLDVTVINVVPLSDKNSLLVVSVSDEDPFEKVNIIVHHSLLEIKYYEFEPGEKLLIQVSFETTAVNGANFTELIADYIQNSNEKEILNRSGCHFPY